MKSFQTSSGHCRFTFNNGYTVSLFNGFGSYTDNKFDMKLMDFGKIDNVESTYCEVAVLKKDKFVTKELIKGADDVIGYLNVDEVMSILDMVSKL